MSLLIVDECKPEEKEQLFGGNQPEALLEDMAKYLLLKFFQGLEMKVNAIVSHIKGTPAFELIGGFP